MTCDLTWLIFNRYVTSLNSFSYITFFLVRLNIRRFWTYFHYEIKT